MREREDSSSILEAVHYDGPYVSGVPRRGSEQGSSIWIPQTDLSCQPLLDSHKNVMRYLSLVNRRLPTCPFCDRLVFDLLNRAKQRTRYPSRSRTWHLLRPLKTTSTAASSSSF